MGWEKIINISDKAWYTVIILRLYYFVMWMQQWVTFNTDQWMLISIVLFVIHSLNFLPVFWDENIFTQNSYIKKLFVM